MVKANGRGGAGAERGGVFVRERLGCADGEVGGRGGGSDPIHISWIWPENELVLFLNYFGGGVGKLNAEELLGNGAKHP